MKKMNKLISMLLTVCMVLGALTGLFTIEISADETTTPEIDLSAIDYLTEKYYTADQKLETLRMAFEKGEYQIFVNDFNGEVAVHNTATGETLFTNPYDVASSKAVASLKAEFLSQILIGYTGNDSTTTNTFNSYNDAALNNQIKVKNIKNGIRVEYTIGREETKYLVPRLITADRFEEFFGDAMKDAMVEDKSEKYPDGKGWYYEKRFLTFYTLRDPEEFAGSDRKLSELYAELPVTQKVGAVYQINEEIKPAELMQLEEYIKTYCPGYSYEQLDEDHDKTEYVSEDQNPAVFKMALEYTLDDLGVTVTLPANGIRFDESIYKLSYITILPYMGAGTYSDATPNTGYTFLPDGSGAIFRFEDLAKAGGTISGQIYGQDYAYHTTSGKYQEVFRMPVYGIVKDNIYTYAYDETSASYTPVVNEDPTSSGFFAIIEEGDGLATLKSYHLGTSAEYHTVQISVNPRPSDTYNLADSISVGNNKSWTVTSERKYVGNYKIRFIMLTDEKVAAEKEITEFYTPDYFGMAKAYQDYLTSPFSTGTQNEPKEKQTSVLTRLKDSEVENKIPLYIETFGTLETVEKILSIPVNVMTPLTTFEDIQTMYEELSDHGGITNINFKLTGYANGGMYSTVPYGLKWEKAVGGKSGFKDLLEYAAKINAGSSKDGKNLGIFPDFDFVYENTLGSFDGFSLRQHAAKTIDNRYIMKRVYVSTYQTFQGYGGLLISPAYYDRFYTKLTKNYLKYVDSSKGINGVNISVATLGTDVNSDFDEDEPYNREDNKGFSIDALKYLSENYNNVMTEGGNAYTWQYVDYILGLSIDSSRYLMASNTVPFSGIVLHGFKQYTGTAINMEGNLKYGILKAIETGASLYFVLTYQNATKLKEDPNLSQNYSVRYDIWAGSYNDEGQFINGELIDLYNDLNSVTADLQTKLIISHKMLDGARIPDEDEIAADAKAEAEAEIAKKELEEKTKAAQTRREHLEARVSVINNATMAYNAAMTKFNSIQIDTQINNLKKQVDKRKAALETLANPGPEDDVEELQETVESAERTIRTLYSANIVSGKDIIKSNYDTAVDKLRVIKEAVEFFKADGTYSEDFIASVEANTAPVEEIVAKIEAIIDSMAEYEARFIEASDGVITVEEEEPEEVVTEEKINEKYLVNDGSIVAVTYGEVGAPYRTFLLNYNYFAVSVEYNGETYSIDAYGFVQIDN